MKNKKSGSRLNDSVINAIADSALRLLLNAGISQIRRSFLIRVASAALEDPAKRFLAERQTRLIHVCHREMRSKRIIVKSGCSDT